MRRRAVALTLAAATVAGCANTSPTGSATPTCSLDESEAALVLEAQSVPRADRVPCIRLLPAGWSVADADYRTGRSRFSLSSDRAGHRAVQVTLQETCDTAGATQVASDEPGTTRFERIEEVTPGFRSLRYYRFPGGCVTYRFRFKESGRALVNEASLALSFVMRRTLNRHVRQETDGRLGL